MKAYQLPEHTCPACGHRYEYAVGATVDSQPRPGDYTICTECMVLLRFDEQLQTEQLTDEQIEALPLSHRMQLLQSYIALMELKSLSTPIAEALEANPDPLLLRSSFTWDGPKGAEPSPPAAGANGPAEPYGHVIVVPEGTKIEFIETMTWANTWENEGGAVCGS